MSEKTISLKTKINNKDLRTSSLENSDYTYVPSYVPNQFTTTVKPFFDRAKEKCQLRDRTHIAYRSMKFTEPIECFLPIIIKAFKETVYHYKRKTIRTSFLPYYYGTLAGMLVVEKRKISVAENRSYNWIV